MKKNILTVLISLFVSGYALAQTTFSYTGLEIVDHQNVYVQIEDLSSNAADIGLTMNRIESRVNIRLRQVGLRPVDPRDDHAKLYLRISVVSNAFHISLSFSRPIDFYRDFLDDDGFFRSPFEEIDDKFRTLGHVYLKGTTGTHGRDSEYIITSLDSLLDQFLSDYLDAND